MRALPEPPASLGKEVLYEVVHGNIALIRLNRPERRNAVSPEVTQALSYLVRATEADPKISVVVLTSSTAGFFCAGADLAAISAGRKDELATEDGGLAGLTDAKREKPWIAAVDGPVLAGGFELCLACDMIVATEQARFGLPEVKRGLFAASGGAHRAARVLPRNIAIELVATGDPMDAQRAFSLGLINRLVPASDLVEEAITLARAVGANAPMAVRESLEITRIATEVTDADARSLSAQAADRVFASEDAREGPLAFLEKRAPSWQGR